MRIFGGLIRMGECCCGTTSRWRLATGKLLGYEVTMKSTSKGLTSKLLVESVLGLTVEDEDESSTSTTKDVGTSTLEEGGHTFVLDDLLQGVGGTLVDSVSDGLLTFHLKTTTDGVKGVSDETGHDDGELSAGPLGGNADERNILCVGVDAEESIVQTELDTTVRDDTGNRDAETVVEGEDALGTVGGLLEAVAETLEGLLAGTDIRGQSSTGVVQGVDDAERTGTGETTGGHVHGKEVTELGLGVVLRELALDGVLKGKVEGLGGEVTDAVGEVTTPESAHALLSAHAGEAVEDTSVSGDLAGHDLGVGILGLDDELHTLDGSGDGLGDRTGDTTGGEVNEEVRVRFAHFRTQ